MPLLLREGDLVVVNETKVLPARLPLRRATGGGAEVLLLEPVSDDRRTWEALVRPARRLRTGEDLFAADGGPVLRIGERTAAGDTFHVELLADGDPLIIIDRLGHVPLPPYLHTPLDRPERYQTVYAQTPGSAAAPTAGLHLTAELLATMTANGIAIAPVDLVVGLDTFQPISVTDPLQHRMHTERYRVPEATWRACADARARRGRRDDQRAGSRERRRTDRLEGRTDLFLHRGADFRVVDVLLTNFHLPRTTLLVLIDAFVGPRWRTLYEAALARTTAS